MYSHSFEKKDDEVDCIIDGKFTQTLKNLSFSVGQEQKNEGLIALIENKLTQHELEKFPVFYLLKLGSESREKLINYIIQYRKKLYSPIPGGPNPFDSEENDIDFSPDNAFVDLLSKFKDVPILDFVNANNNTISLFISFNSLIFKFNEHGIQCSQLLNLKSDDLENILNWATESIERLIALNDGNEIVLQQLKILIKTKMTNENSPIFSG